MTERQQEGVSLAEFAKSVGATYSDVQKKIKAGKISEDCFFEDGSVDEEKARVEWFATLNPNRMRNRDRDKPKPPTKNPKEHAAAAREKRTEFLTKQEREEVDLETARVKLSILKKEYVPVEDARRAQRAIARTTRDMFLNFSARYGPEMAGELGVDPGVLIGLLEAKIRTALNEAAAKPPVFDEDTE
jgi:hypothetical protein